MNCWIIITHTYGYKLENGHFVHFCLKQVNNTHCMWICNYKDSHMHCHFFNNHASDGPSLSQSQVGAKTMVGPLFRDEIAAILVRLNPFFFG